MKCQKCAYVWITASTHWLVSCPSCGTKVKNTDNIIGNPLEPNILGKSPSETEGGIK
jgi:hypothetical protein